jgi:hypothetical protein
MSLFLRIFNHLLPNAKAFRITADKQLREYFEGLSTVGEDTKDFLDEVWSDIDPALTRELSAWESQFGLRNTDITEQERRDRLSAAWKALGGQDPKYIQDTLRNSGFDVYVHEWWSPGTEPAVDVKSCVTPRDPLTLIVPPAFPLVNKITETKADLTVLAGEALAAAGEISAEAGNYLGFIETIRDYYIPTDPNYWNYFFYIGGQTFGNFANVDINRRDEFEELCLKICPTQLWLGMFITYV